MTVTEHFQCPYCGEKTLEHRADNAVVLTQVLGVEWNYGDVVYSPDKDILEADSSFQCEMCGELIAHDEEELIRLLKADKLAREQGLKRYKVYGGYGDEEVSYFFWAEDEQHALEQAEDANPDVEYLEPALCPGQENE